MVRTDLAQATTDFITQCVNAGSIFVTKNRQYGNAIEETGVLGAAVEIVGVAARLKQLVLKAPDQGRSEEEAIRNVLTDLHNYANIGLMMLDKGNWTGTDIESE